MDKQPPAARYKAATAGRVWPNSRFVSPAQASPVQGTYKTLSHCYMYTVRTNPDPMFRQLAVREVSLNFNQKTRDR